MSSLKDFDFPDRPWDSKQKHQKSPARTWLGSAVSVQPRLCGIGEEGQQLNEAGPGSATVCGAEVQPAVAGNAEVRCSFWDVVVFF